MSTCSRVIVAQGDATITLLKYIYYKAYLNNHTTI